MKFVILSVSHALLVNSQLTSTCFDGNLVLDIPYPDERTAKLLYLSAGSCDETNYGGSFTYDSTTSVAKVTIPIDACDMRGALYSEPVTYRSGGLYRPTANVTFGEKISGFDVIFRNMNIAAECGKRTSYKVSFNYTAISSSDKEECQELDGVCVFPAYEDNIILEIKEYTDDSFVNEVDETTRAKLAGKNIYLSMRATTMTDGYKFAVTDCTIISPAGERFLLMEPGATTDPTCGLDGVGLTAAYDSYNFNFQHVLFMLNSVGVSGVSSFHLECTAEICEKNDADSKCNTSVLPCMNSEAEKERYMCDEHCAVGETCGIVSDAPVCSV